MCKSIVPVAVLGLLLGACGASSADSASTSVSLPQGSTPVKLDPRDFSTTITNPYWPMPVGRRWTLIETDGDGTTSQVVIIVTDQTHTMPNGVTARVVRDTVTSGGQIVEDTIDWYAQDKAGNVWYLGEDTAEFVDGKISSTHGSFQAGKDGALAGIAVPASPRPGLAYRQEYLRGEAEDEAAVLSVHELVEVPFGNYKDALLTRDTTPLEPDAQEYKVYAAGVGPVLVLRTSGGSAREELVAIDTAPAGAGTGPLGTP